MKKIALSIALPMLAVALISSVYHFTKKKTIAGTVKIKEGQDAEDFIKWDQKRLADPATGRIPDNIRAKELAFAATLPNDAQFAHRMAGTNTWNMRGPWNVGGRTRSFAADVNSEAILLAGTCAGGMWRSADSGKTWTLTTPLATEQSVSCLAQDTRANHSNVWYYGSGECYGTSASAAGAFYLGNGLYRSLDDGQTWKVLPATNVNSNSFKSFWQALWNVATDPSAPDSLSVVYACSIGAVYRSSDTGNTWKTVLGGSTSSYSYYTDVQVSATGVVYATLSSDGPQKGIWRSTDGIHYTNITPPGFPASYNRIVIGISPTDPNQVYFLANTNGAGMPDTNFLGEVEWDGLWKYKYLSGDGDSAGGVWWNLTANLPHTGGLFDKYNSQTSYDMIVRFFPTDTSTIYIGGTDLFRSTTGFFDADHTAHIGGYGVGTSIPAIQVYPGHHPDQHMVFFSNSNPYIMYSSCDGGLFKTLNDTASNVSWITFDYGYVTTMFYTVASAHDIPGSSVLIGGAQDNDCLFDNSTSLTAPWTKPIFGDGSFVAIEDSAKTFYYSSEDGKMYKAQMDTIAGTVTAFNRIDPIGGKDYQFVNPYAIDPNNSNIMYLAGGKYLWRNNNLSGIPYANQYDSISTNWIQFPDSVPVAGVTISAVAVSTVPANRVYFGTSDQRLYRIDSANTGT
ncbi:MAG: WD40/YVTN/BNR-like repeat-containing protein, partial [Bacteroidia bacterium]